MIPIKAIILNLLSVGAAYGILTLVFQDGHGEKVLGFNSVGGITPWLPLFLFVVLFGLSMDYHVFVLSRVRELVDRGMSTENAVAEGIKSTAGVITGAAAVMVVTFGAFATGSDQEMKQLGIGLAAAILIDATIVRAVLLPGDDEAPRQPQLVPAQAAGLAAEVRARAGGGARAGLIHSTSRSYTATPAFQRASLRFTAAVLRRARRRAARSAAGAVALRRCSSVRRGAPRRRRGSGLLGLAGVGEDPADDLPGVRALRHDRGTLDHRVSRPAAAGEPRDDRADGVVRVGRDGLGRRGHGAREGHGGLVHRAVGGRGSAAATASAKSVSAVSGRRVMWRKPTSSASESTGSSRPPQLGQSSPTSSAGAPEL